MDDDVVIIGVDPSSKKLALVMTVGDGGPTGWTTKLTAQDVGARCDAAYDAIRGFMRTVPPEGRVFVFIEEPVVGRGGVHSTMVQAKVNGAVTAAFHASRVCEAIRTSNNSHAKKKVVGKGNASKDEIKAWARTYWKQLYTVAGHGADQDLLDAGMHNRYGAGVVKLMTRLERRRRRPLRKLRRPS